MNKKQLINQINLLAYIMLGGFFMNFSDNFFKKIENKTNVNKDTIISLANKLQGSNMKDEKTLREVISDLSKITGREVSKEKEQKIIDTILNDNVPKNLDKFI